MTSTRSALTLLASSLMAAKAIASPCEVVIPNDPADLGRFSAYECHAPGAVGPVCVLDYTNGALKIAFPAAPTFHEDGKVREVLEKDAAVFFRRDCLKHEGGLIPWYDEPHCVAWGTNTNSVRFARASRSVEIDFSYVDSRKKKNNRTGKYKGSCTAYSIHEDKLVTLLQSHVLKNATGQAFQVKSVDTSSDRLTLGEIPSQKETQISYPEVPSYSRFGWTQMSRAHLGNGALDPRVMSGRTFQCFTSTADGSTMVASSGVARIQFQAIPRRKTELGLTSSLQVKVLRPFSERATLPDGSTSATLYDGDNATFFLVPKSSGVDYSRVTALDAAQGMQSFGVRLGSFMMRDTLCFQE